jgi:hypothetical protein|eukprot:Transcript_24115.p3 GENE.Transcript_24115~~Transcript_24115.p3  ORF type:complete len:167 (-),score=48.71 Transcript_24115:977-1477(-)
MGLLNRSKSKEKPQPKPDASSAGATSSPAPAVAPPGRELSRKLSVMSQKTVETLESLEEQLSSMKLHCDEAEHDLDNPGDEGFRLGLRSDLAALHGNANRLLATRLDAILTSELNSGRDEARAKRKALIGQSEALIDRCEALVKRYDQEKERVGAESSPQQRGAAQ